MKTTKIDYIRRDAQQSLGDKSPERQKERPLSPHLQIYKFEWTMAYSIFHRISAIGVGIIALLSSTYLLLFWEEGLYTLVHNFFLFKIIFTGAVACVGYYIFATLKYMVWSTGRALDLKTAKLLGHLSFIATVIFTIGVIFNANIF